MEEKGRVNTFVNDGSFMEMFRKRMEEEKLRGKGDQSVSGVKDEELPGSSSQAQGEPGVAVSEVSSGLTTPTAIEKETRLLDQTATNKTDSGIEQSCDDNLQTLSKQQNAEDIDSNSERKHEKRKSKWEQKKVIEEEVATEDSSKTTSTVTSAQKKYSLLSHVGKRKGGKLSLKTGTVKKQRTPETQAQDPWSKYMAEVEKYKAHVCGDEDKSRPLVK